MRLGKSFFFVLVSLYLIITFFAQTAFAQTAFGNEWIRPGQPYLKINIVENGIYRINKSLLQSFELVTQNLSPKNIQIFFRGEEIPLFVSGESDGSFDDGDFIEFYGIKNDGKLDQVLYKQPNTQPNTEVSLFSDQSTYFLTVGNTLGKRYTTPAVNSPVVENLMVYTSSQNYAETYYPGEYILEAMSLSEYIEGEGYLGQTYGLGSGQDKTFATPGALTGTSFSPYIDYYVAGRSNASSSNGARNNHHLKISVGGIIVTDTLFKGYATARARKTIAQISGSSTLINFSSANDLGAATDFQAIGYARITYPRSFDASGYGFLSFRLQTTNAESNLTFTNTSWNNGFIYDYVNGFRYPGLKIGNSFSFSVKNPKNNELIVCNDNAVKTPILENVSIAPINANEMDANLLIVTNQKLLSSASEYAAYKSSQGFKPFIITTDDLYNQFCYGVHHPLAIRNFVRYLVSQAKLKPNYLLLLGKGYETPKNNLDNDLVPTMGYPSSDNFLTSEIVDDSFAPALATGRVPARSDAEVRRYLEKVKTYANQPNDLYRKNIVNITGGGNSDEDVTFSSYLRNMANVAGNPFFGAKTISFYKSDTNPITGDLKQKITSAINGGSGLINYLGHGSTMGTAVTLGDLPNLTNANKLLFYLVNGCSTGNAFVTESMGEDYLLKSDKGAIGWIGTSSEGVASYLYNFSSLFFDNAFKSNYGNSVAQNMALALKGYQNKSDNLNIAHARQYILLGDPTISLYAPDKADYELNDQSGTIIENPIATNPQIKLSLIVKNKGKAIESPVKVLVQRTLSDNTVINYPAQSFPAILNTDTLVVVLDNAMANVAGNNSFKVTVDPNNEIDELTETNNICQFSYLLGSEDISPITPNDYGIVNTPNVKLTVQPGNVLSKDNIYSFEIDTVKTFNSSWKKTSSNINGNAIASWTTDIEPQNQKVYYWRAKTANANAVWKASSFTYISAQSGGWSQSHYQQLEQITLKNIDNNSPGFSYVTTSYPVRIRTSGNDATNVPERRIRMGGSSASSSFYTSDFQGLALIAMNPINPEDNFGYPSIEFRPGQAYNYKQYYFDTNQPRHVDSLLSYLNQIPNGYFVGGMSGINFNPQSLPQNVLASLNNLGLAKLGMINNGEPYAFLGRKGTAPGTATEITGDYTNGIPVTQQSIDNTFNVPTPASNGEYLSEQIGPALKWKSANFNLTTDANDQLQYDIIGIDSAGAETTVKTSNTPSVDLSDISANQYKYIRLKISTRDDVTKTVANLKMWQVFYDDIPDISFDADYAYSFKDKHLQQGDSLKVDLGIINLEQVKSDSIAVNYKITKSDRSVISGLINKIDSLKAGEQRKISFSYPTNTLSGNTTLQLNVLPKDGKDKREFNSFATFSFDVATDQKPPTVDVLFDNKRIINREIVAPQPVISIAVTDENKFLILKDTTASEIYIKKESDATFKRVAFSNNKVVIESAGNASNNKINFSYRPDRLEDGIYTLRVRSKDASGNYVEKNDYDINFEVINQQTLTNFLPYPNPFTTKMKFVFQLTGKVPDKLLVRIMTVGGKIVREVRKEELGAIKIGNNVSDFTWDGTDQYGDRLANGIYFYQVLTENEDGSKAEHRSNASDQFFKKNFGKIYLMR